MNNEIKLKVDINYNLASNLYLKGDLPGALIIVKDHLKNKNLSKANIKRFSNLYSRINYKIYLCSQKNENDITTPLLETIRQQLLRRTVSETKLVNLFFNAHLINVAPIIEEIKMFLAKNETNNQCKTILLGVLSEQNYNKVLKVSKYHKVYLINPAKDYNLFDATNSFAKAIAILEDSFINYYSPVNAIALETLLIYKEFLQTYYLQVYPNVPEKNDINALVGAVFCFNAIHNKTSCEMKKLVKILNVSQKLIFDYLHRLEYFNWS